MPESNTVGDRMSEQKQKQHNWEPPPLFRFALGEYSLLPVQFDSASQVGLGERRLMIAVLEDAIQCLQLQARVEWYRRPIKAQRAANEAREWFESDDESHMFTFLRICYALGLEPEWLRRKIRQLSRKARKARQAHAT